MPTPEEIAGIKSKLDTERARLLQSFARLDPALLLRPAGPGGWSRKDLPAPVILSQVINPKFARSMVIQDAPKAPWLASRYL